MSAFAVSNLLLRHLLHIRIGTASPARRRDRPREVNFPERAATGSRSLRSFDSARKRFMSLTTAGSESRLSTSTRRRSSCLFDAESVFHDET